MYVNINSVSEDNRGSGSNSWLNTSVSCSLERTAPPHLGAPVWHIEVSGDMVDEKNKLNPVLRTVQIHFTPEDIERLVQLLQDNGLLNDVLRE